MAADHDLWTMPLTDRIPAGVIDDFLACAFVSTSISSIEQQSSPRVEIDSWRRWLLWQTWAVPA
ncbi:MAG TPA: hypothetical protein VK821_01495 [Dehalococcoidia bacterium]|nr:hypothetical protein [Dehalococcoidia bacterium]